MTDAAPPALDAGNYEIIRGRLVTQGQALRQKAEALNARRKEVFGGTELSVIAQSRVRTENNCLPRDLRSVGGHLLLGYEVAFGLKQDVSVEDVFALHQFEHADDIAEFPKESFEAAGGFLQDPGFVKDFTDLFRYYREARLLQLRRLDSLLLAVFQVGQALSDIKVFRWRVQKGGTLQYVDNRGERDYTFPPAHDFTWRSTTREMQVHGQHPHININNRVFVETVGGDLTVKVENNTSDGQGIYREPVDDQNQTLDDGDISYADLGTLILLKIRPYREEKHRYLVFNTRTQGVVRIDAIGRACVQLPEDHGIIFPGGYVLQDGSHKVFDEVNERLRFKAMVRAPNGEDVLYVFYDPVDGHYALLPYNLIRKEVQTPIHCQGYSLFQDGRMVVFRSVTGEPTRVHPLQVWQTPFVSAEFAASAPTDGSFLAKVGNADLVRGISDALSICRLIDNSKPTRQIYEDLIGALGRLGDAYYWLGHDEVGFAAVVTELRRTAELIVDEFEKVLALQRRAAQTLTEVEAKQAEVIRGLRQAELNTVEAYMRGLTALRTQRGHLITVRDVRYIDAGRLDALEAEAVEHFDRLTRECVLFLQRDSALGPLKADIATLLADVEKAEKVSEINPLRDRMEALSQGLDLLTEIIAGLQIDDATTRTAILEDISEVFGQLNRVRATLEVRRKGLLGQEGRAEFGAQFKLFGQSVASALALCDSPERCDAELSRLMVGLEELEARFSEFDEFIADLTAKREEVYEAFGSRKQTLLDERQRRVGNLLKAADRILEGVVRRARSFQGEDELNAWFAADNMVLKLRQLSEQLAELGDGVKADELVSRLKSARQDALRGLRDKLDLFEGGGSLIKLGSHQFTVNTQPLELTLVPRDEGMALHLTGTDFFEPVTDEAFQATKPWWSQTIISESPAVYRGEYLATTLLEAAERGQDGLSIKGLQDAQLSPGGLLALVRERAQQRYEEGYERGLHDHDATLILEKLLAMRTTAGLLRFGAWPRAVAALAWGAGLGGDARTAWQRRARNLCRLRDRFGPGDAFRQLGDAFAAAVTAWLTDRHLPELLPHALLAGRYLVEELGAQDPPRFTTSRDAEDLRAALHRHLEETDARREFDEDLRALKADPVARVDLARAWIGALAGPEAEAGTVFEAAVLAAGDAVAREVSSAVVRTEVKGLLGQHPRIREQVLPLQLDELLGRLAHYREVWLPGYQRYRQARHALLDDARIRLRLNEFQPRIMSSFVRNRLISEVYLPIIGDNLAKQMGAAGEKKRTDLMGLLLLVSPPGYGKTTLMEYVANRLGLVFVKVNGPALGHSVTSLDPAEAPNATARQEVEKINLAFEMGNNVMLYLDDIQHTHPELLQKFISLCDGQRRVEGVWRGRTRTYDLRGRKFCVVMAGNPYTETGAKFQIPDMLANRADTYNLGDILEGRDEAFSLSYLENALTSNAVLAPLAGRDQGDVYRLIRMARGEEVPQSELKHDYSAVEVAEITAVFQRMLTIQRVVLRVNLQYIESAAQEDAFRSEPPFKLQGSYRNMNKMAEKVASAMNAAELEALIDDHYTGEAQTLTTGAEANLLKLAELRARMSEAQAARWAEIKRGFKRVQISGGKDDDPAVRVATTLSGIAEGLDALRTAVAAGSNDGITSEIKALREAVAERGVDARAFTPIAAALGAIRDELEGGGAAALANALGTIALKLDGLRSAVAKAGGGGQALPPVAAARPLGAPPPAAASGDVTEALTAVAQALQAVGRPQVEVRMPPPAGIEELLGQQVAIVERTLVPLVKASAENLRDAQAIGRHVEELIALLREVDAGLRK
ncbi:MAG: DNA repair ATPase [Myxococcales bacterium]|nr:DNA repair ATPase [Myxococcales bacterium]